MNFRTLKIQLAVFLGLVHLSSYADLIEVNVYKMQFIPATISINKGDTVRWNNIEKRQYHNVWFDSLNTEEPDYFFPTESYEKTFDEVGIYDYRCGPHPKMKGAVNVSDASKALSSKRIAELEYLVKQDCGSCHGMLFKGGLGPALLPDNLSSRTTNQIADIVLYGMPNTAMPPWKGILSKQEARWIAQSLRSGTLTSE